MKTLLRPAISLFCLLTLVTGVAYPMCITLIAQLLFPHQANGSLVIRNGNVVGSELIGQNFSAPQYFWGRPSATGGTPCNGTASGGSNLGPSNPALLEAVKERIAALHTAAPDQPGAVPVDLVTASGSGLDPQISIAAAKYQAGRVAHSRGKDIAQIEALIEKHATRPSLPGFSEPVVNVLALNLALDGME